MDRIFKKVVSFIFFWAFIFLLAACNKKKGENPEPKFKSRNVKYEIKGNYTGKVNIVYTDIDGSMKTELLVSLPWIKEITVQNSIGAVAMNASTSSTSNIGVPGETGSAKIYIGNVVEANVDATTDSTGRIQFNNLTYVY